MTGVGIISLTNSAYVHLPDIEEEKMRKSLVLLFCLILVICGCNSVGYKQFYVRSHGNGYSVSCHHSGGDVDITKSFVSPKEAQDLAEKLNKEVGDNWAAKDTN